MQWKPNTTVAAMIVQDGKFLLVEEATDRGNRYNQPAGHLEDAETLLQGVIREVREETAYGFVPQALLGIYHWRQPHNGITYLRFCFIGKAEDHRPEIGLDEGIIRAIWLSLEDVRALDAQQLTRSPQVLQCIEDYLSGQYFPLSVLTHLDSNGEKL